MEKQNKILIKYDLKQPHEYWILKKNLKPEEAAIPKKRNPSQASPGHRESIASRIIDGPDSDHAGLDLPDDCIRIYTDGASSGNPGPAGIGVVLIYKENKKEISLPIGRATNNIAELMAIKLALDSLKRFDLPVRLFTDSSYALGLITQEWNPRVNKELVRQIKERVSRFKDIKLIKVKGHSGVKENEVADYLATSAIKKGPL